MTMNRQSCDLIVEMETPVRYNISIIHIIT